MWNENVQIDKKKKNENNSSHKLNNVLNTFLNINSRFNKILRNRRFFGLTDTFFAENEMGKKWMDFKKNKIYKHETDNKVKRKHWKHDENVKEEEEQEQAQRYQRDLIKKKNRGFFCSTFVCAWMENRLWNRVLEGTCLTLLKSWLVWSNERNCDVD